MIDLFNRIYSDFDLLVEKYGVEKIRTIGDNYMVASGVPEPCPEHAQALAGLALDMLDYCEQLEKIQDKKIQFRIGINSGPLIAGVIGNRRFQYDLWGDAVNTASRMESQGVAEKIQVSQATYELLKEKFILEQRGTIDVKGKGLMKTWFLTSRKETIAA
jgi:class 3 adenylate cyclase